VDDARCLLRTQGDSLEWLAFMLLWFGVDFEVHEPPELVDHISAVASRLERSAARRSP
jgi:predicted DNA-binding transcriptional regulator YafY